MPRNRHQKVKLLYLVDILRMETDSHHPLRTNDIVDRLVALQIPEDRRTLTKDVEILNEMGYEVGVTTIGHQKAYYIEDKTLSILELKVLTDAVQAVPFVTEEQTEVMIDKITTLGGFQRSGVLKRNVITFDTVKRANEAIYDALMECEHAIRKQKKLMFRHFNYSAKHRPLYTNEDEPYVVDPIAVVYFEGNYYLLAYDERDRIGKFRVDRMTDLRVLEDKDVRPDAVLNRRNAKKYAAEARRLFAGEEEDMFFAFNKAVLNDVYDRFGEDLNIKIRDDGRYETTVKTVVTPSLLGWLFIHAGDIEVFGPDAITGAYQAQLAKAQ